MRRLDWGLIGIIVFSVLGALSLGCGLISIILTMEAHGAW